METLRERLNTNSGSGFIEVLRDDMLVKQESGYGVTPQTALIDSLEEMDDDDDDDSGCLILDSWITAATIKEIIRIKRTVAEMAMTVSSLFLVGF